jgi:hypothetical protein
VSPAEVVALPGWRWRPGALAVRVGLSLAGADGSGDARLGRSYRVLRVGRVVTCAGEAFAPDSPDFAPHPADPATLGCLLALVREAWPAECPAHAGRGDGGTWRVWLGERVSANVTHHRYIGDGPTEWDALAAALAAAPGRAS